MLMVNQELMIPPKLRSLTFLVKTFLICMPEPRFHIFINLAAE